MTRSVTTPGAAVRVRAARLPVALWLALGAVPLALAVEPLARAAPGKPAVPSKAGAPARSGATHAAKPPAPAVPPPPLPMLPSIARVKVDVHKAQLVIVEEVSLPRGEWKSEPLDFYVAFGAPGAPRAIDAQLLAIADGALEAADDQIGEALSVERAPRRPPSAHPLIGRDTMAGVVVHVRPDALSRALAPGNMAALRIRTALELPDEDASAARGVVIRLGSSRGTPLTLGRLSLGAKPGAPPIARASARLCGPEADASPLAIAITPRPSPADPNASPAVAAAPIAPVLAVRHASDDLCVRFWTLP